MNKIKIGYKKLLLEASKVINEISVSEGITLLKDNNYLFVDLRDVREIKREGKIPNSFSCPRGMLEFWIDPESPYFKKIFNQKKHFIFYCASGWRSALSCKTAMEMGLEPVSSLQGGYSEWKKLKGPFEII